MEKVSKSEEETKEIAKDFLKNILISSHKDSKKACVVGLYGDLGVGKTTFTQAVSFYLGVKKKVNSPTFTIMKIYDLKNKNFKRLFHLDAFRLKNENELLLLGWKEIISNPDNLVFVEWPEHVRKIMPKKHHVVAISHTKERYRKFKIKHV